MEFLQCNGIVALTGDSLQKLAFPCLMSLRHRGWFGFYILGHKLGHINRLSVLDGLTTRKLLAGCVKSMTFPADPQIVFHGSIYNKNSSFLSKLALLLEEGKLKDAASLLSGCDGDYTLALYSSNKLIFGRSPLGVKPLYSGRKSDLFGISTEKRALKTAGITKINSVEPGFLYAFDKHGLERYEIESTSDGLNSASLEEAAERFEILLFQSVRSRIKGHRSVAVGFSGGLDSAVIASVASKITKVRLVSTFVKGSHDYHYTRLAADALGLEFETCEIAAESLKGLGMQISRLVESKKLMDIAIALPLYLTAMSAAGTGCDALMLGQLSDELFGGYQRYLTLYEKFGAEEAVRAMEHDVRHAYLINFERDDKALSPFLNPILPYASAEVVKNALQIPISYKVDLERKTRKLVLRIVALRLGLPEEIVWSPKKAVQYSSGTQKLLSNQI